MPLRWQRQAAGSADTAVFYSYANNTFARALPAAVPLPGTTTMGATATNYTFTTRANSYLAGGGVLIRQRQRQSEPDIVRRRNVHRHLDGEHVECGGRATITVNTGFENSSTPITAVPSQVSVNGASSGTDRQPASTMPRARTRFNASGTNATLTNSIDTISVNRIWHRQCLR